MDISMEALCPICREIFESPRLLVCGHVFCSSCLHAFALSKTNSNHTTDKAKIDSSSSLQNQSISSSYENNDAPSQQISSHDTQQMSSAEAITLSCPICRTETLFTIDAIDCLPLSELHLQWAESARIATSNRADLTQIHPHSQQHKGIHRNTRSCLFDGCENPALFTCLSGCGDICSVCIDWHKKAPMSSKHVVCKINETDNISVPLHVCGKHEGLPFELYCNHCTNDPFMCYKCAYHDKTVNPDHVHVKYEESLQTLDQESVLLLQDSEKKLKDLELQRQHLIQDHAKMEDQAELIKSKIREKMDEHRQKLDEFRSRLDKIELELVETADRLHGEVSKSIELQLEDVEATYNCVEFGQKLYQEALRWRKDYASPHKLPYARRFLHASLARNIQAIVPVNKEIVFRPSQSIVMHFQAPQSLHWVDVKREHRSIARAFEDFGPMVRKLGGPNYGSTPGQFYYPWGIAVHPRTGRLYVADRSNHRIQVLSPDLDIVSVFGSLGNGSKHFNGPQGIAVSETGQVAVVDYCNHRVQIFDSAFGYLHTLGTGTPGEADGQFSNPYNAVFDREGNIFVTDLSNSRVQKFDAHGRFLCAFGQAGSGAAETRLAEGICLTDEDEVCILGYGTDTLKFFNTHGEFLRGVKIQFVNRNSLCMGPAGSIFVSDYSRHQILIYSRDGNLIRAFGTNGDGDGQLNNPMGIAFGLNNRLYVCEYNNHRIQVF